MPVLTLGGAGDMTVNAVNSLPVGSLMGKTFDRDADGHLILDDNNLPTIKKNASGANDVMQILGKIYPDWLLGFSTGFTWKGLSFNLMIDGKLGHNLYSYSNRIGSLLGSLSTTVEGRDEWEIAKQTNASTGVLPNMGYMVEGVKNGVYGSYAVDPQQYWQRVEGIDEMWVYDASYLRLRQVSLAYRLSKSVHKVKFLDDISFSANFNNLCYLMKRTPNVSPESSISTGNATGIEVFAMPETMQFTFGVNISF